MRDTDMEKFSDSLTGSKNKVVKKLNKSFFWSPSVGSRYTEVNLLQATERNLHFRSKVNFNRLRLIGRCQFISQTRTVSIIFLHVFVNYPVLNQVFNE